MHRVGGQRALVFALAVLTPAGASAYEARVDASLDTQFYSMQSPYGEPYLYRRRYTSTLGLELDHIGGEPSFRGPSLSFRSRLRVDADFGQQDSERDPSSERYVPGLTQAPLDVMYAYLDGRGYFRGLVDFRLGRQYLIDALGYWSFDGALLRLNLLSVLALSGFAGFEQRLGLPMLASGRFSGTGVWRGNRDDLELNQYPAYLEDSALAPAYGVALETAGIPHVYSRVSYRRVENRSTVLVSPFFGDAAAVRTYGEARVSSERLGYTGRFELPDVGALSGRAVYDLYSQAVTDARVDVDVPLGAALGVGAELDYYYPTFDGDSIFNWFTHRGMTTAQARATFVPKGPVDFALTSGVRWFETEGDPETYATPAGAAEPERPTTRSADFIAHGSGRYRFGPGSLALNAMLETGKTARIAGADLVTRRVFAGGRYDALLITSLYDWADSLRPDRSATSFTYVAGGGVRPGPTQNSRGRIGFEWEHSMNRLVGQRFRLLLTLDFTVLQ